MPTISVIIPIYNVERYLRRCLDGLLHQTFADWEAICVNDGSKDGSAAILEEYAGRDSRFKIVTKANGGISDARNVGMLQCTGEYVMYVDSDDLIHPQTMEIALALARRDSSDIVSWYKDRLFNIKTKVRAALGLDFSSFVPSEVHKRYSLSRIDSYVTDDIFNHLTEVSNSPIKYPIKHFYVWRYLIRREFIKDLSFVEGLIYEDFPWCSEMMLRCPRTTITSLPFYYYTPNVSSVDHSTGHARKISNWLRGLDISTSIYEERANQYQDSKWRINCMWPVVVYQIASKLRKIDSTEDYSEIREKLKGLWEKGVFDNPPTKKEEYHVRLIKDFIDHR